VRCRPQSGWQFLAQLRTLHWRLRGRCHRSPKVQLWHPRYVEERAHYLHVLAAYKIQQTILRHKYLPNHYCGCFTKLADSATVLVNESPEKTSNIKINLALLVIEGPWRCCCLPLMKIYHLIEKAACLGLSTKDTDCFIRVQRVERRVENIGLQGEIIRYTAPVYCARFIVCCVFNIDTSNERLFNHHSAEDGDGRLPITDEDPPPNIAPFSSFKPGIAVSGKVGWQSLIV